MHYISVSRIGRVVAVLTLGIATATLLCGCARVRRVSASDVMTTPQATVPAQPIAVPMPPTTIQPPSPITSVPAPPTVIKPPQAKEVEGKPTETKPVEEKPAKPSVDVRKDIERLNELTAQLEQAVVAGKVADFVPQLLQVLLQLAYVEVHAVDEIRASGDILRVSDVIEAVDALRSNLREVRNALERGNQRIAGAAFDEVKAQLPKLQTLIMEAIGAKKLKPATGSP
ncbi:MAG TPA: hypothetical protein EYP10_07655 [Armatimonadetes bacterium]|nr:hypothetical protein [Armatimonadota bacterium]